MSAAALKAGIVGLGNMGRGIAENLDRAGFLAAAWDAHPPALSACTLGGTVARRREAVAECAVILLAVPGSGEVSALFDDGLLDGPAGRVFIDLTTSDPEATRALAARAEAAGAAYLDAGMTGGAAGAASGKLTLMLGGEEAALSRARPVLEQIAARLFHLGPCGAGHAMKLAHNMICHTIFLATAEGCRAAEKAGVPLERAVEVLNAGNARSFVSERRFPDHIVSGTFDGRSQVANLAKDLAMAAEVFDRLGQPAAYAGLSAELLDTARRLGMAEEDFTRLYPEYDRVIGAWDRPPMQAAKSKRQ
ncbi:NAD(P)-dependent oxidoreductase [Chelativorans sp. M5D2P16]|uniref:NAD(P)-dependent oxidoreductase n=1 Tax=Chelativorans sp. M5D2P16 TaxID=3095678 RepID=UPI002ACAB2E7|nr:NAD(P)-dependent oxidoreductase [Chelativorans sp. M5D2P16]MDZ5696630.1 NAD(P)-dependent oxidoreductase [Chelativorans sp. M5D2P16]